MFKKDYIRILDVSRQLNLTVDNVIAELPYPPQEKKGLDKYSKIPFAIYEELEKRFLDNIEIKKEVASKRDHRKRKLEKQVTLYEEPTEKLPPKVRAEKVNAALLDNKTINSKGRNPNSKKRFLKGPLKKVRKFGAKIMGKGWFLSKGKNKKGK